jgi:hypothetical protein
MSTEENKDNKRIQTGGGAAVEGDVNTGGGDFVGRDQIIEEHVYVPARDREEKGGCLLFIERGFTFALSFVIGGIVMGIFGGLIGAVAGGGEDGALVGAVLGGILGLIFAVVATGNVSRYRQG